MIKYAKVINEETGLCEVGTGTNAEFYQSIGMTQLDVEISDVDNNWYLTEKCPHKTDDEKAQERQAEFESDFFEIANFGWFRKKPKGYSSAVESLNTAFNAVTIMQKLPAGMLIFYQAPDFYDPSQCTEEWLIEHQTVNEEMTAQEFGVFYVGFMTAWNNQEHVNEVENEDTTNE
jgi:hypothetical protein